MHWFKHDADASQDAKLQNVLLDYGLEGYGLYWYCLELIVGKIDVDNITFELEHDARIIARNTGSTAQKVEEMMRYFVAQGLFESNASGNVTCLKLAKRLDKSMTSNSRMRELIDKIRGKNHDAVMISHDDSMINPDGVMQDKIRVDKKREKDLVDSVESPSEQKADFLSELFDRFWGHYKTKQSKQAAQKSFYKFLKGKSEGQSRFWMNLMLAYYMDCRERQVVGYDALHASTYINQKRWEDNPEFMQNFKAEWLAENGQ
jgi:hypothetical protein